MDAPMFPRLCFVLSPRHCARDPIETARLALEGGVDLLQLREKEASDAEFAALARSLARLCAERGVPLILNDRVHMVDATGARGVHLGEEDMPVQEARALLGPDALIGLSVHNPAEAASAAKADGPSYLGLGPIFPTTTKDLTRDPGGATLVASVRSTLPIFPIGGITPENAPSLIAAGATRLAVSSAIGGARDPSAVAAQLRGMLPS